MQENLQQIGINAGPERGSASSRFKLAIIGAGLITRSAHLPTALSLPEIEVVALVDPVVSRAAELAQEYGIKR